MKLSGVFLPFILTFLAPNANADRLTMYLYPSQGINWRTPGTLARTSILSELEDIGTLRHPVGHANIEVSCDSTGEHFFTGTTSEGSSEERELLVKGGIGLGILFHDFLGRLEVDSDIEPKLSTFYRKGGMSFLEYEISPEACARLSEYRRQYEERGYGLHYGLPNRPRMGEGAGCTAYAVSFLELAGLLGPELRAEWSRTISVPDYLIGGKLTGRRVSLVRLLFDFRSPWATGEPSHDVFFWDPDLMFRWAWTRYESPWPGEEPVSRGQARGVRIPALDVPVPSDPIWQRAVTP